MFQGQHRQKLLRPPPQQICQSWWCTINPRCVGGKHVRPIQKLTKAKRTEGMTQVVECLLSQCNALNSIFSTDRKNFKKELLTFHLESF
jgi:hypothetical protein